MTTPRDIRHQNSRHAARILIQSVLLHCKEPIGSIIQCGLGDWAEGPILEEFYSVVWVPRMAVEPVVRYVEEAKEKGFGGPIIEAALWDETGIAIPFNDNRTQTSVFDKQKGPMPSFTARSMTLDDAVAVADFHPKRCLLWMDIEGSELIALRGMRQTLREVSAIIIELRDEPKFPGWPTTAMVTEFLDQAGFVKIHRHRQDSVFLRKELLVCE